MSRGRLSIGSALAVFSVASLVFSASAADAPAAAFRAVTIDDQISIGYGLAIADIDGDGQLDVVLADKQAFVWYHNPDWKKHVLAERLTEADNVCVAAADLDGDGKAEIAVGAGWNPSDTIASGALFYLKAPADRTQRWEPIRLAHDPTIHRIRWMMNRDGTRDLISVPLHGRGNKNGAGDGVRILAYHPPADPNAAWTTTVLADQWHATHNAEVFRSGTGTGARDEMLVAGKEGVFSFAQTPTGWRIKALATNGPAMPGFAGAGEVRSGRIGQRLAFAATIEPMHGNQVVVYEPPAVTAVSELWSRKVLDESLVDGHGLVAGDFLGIGRDQLAAGWRAMTKPGTRVGIRLYTPATEKPLGEWTTATIDDNQMACEDLQAADIDGDGDIDLIASGRATKNVKIYFNERIRRP